MKRKVIFGGIVAVLLTTLLIVIFRIPQTPPKSKAEAEKEAILEALEERGYQKVEELKPPVVYADEEGNEVGFWVYTCTDPERNGEGVPKLVRDEVFDPETADASRPVQIGELTGTIYEKEDWAYLIWSPIDDMRSVTTVIKYPYKSVKEELIVNMAVNVRQGAA